MMGYTLTLKEVRDVADGTRLFIFDKPAEYVFKAGQYAAVVAPKIDAIETDAKGLTRSLSIASAPCEPDLAFAMRGGDSSFKRTFWQLKPGDRVTATKAVGFSTIDSGERRPIVFLIGGIGITPARAILKQAEYEKDERSFILLYANRFLKDAAFYEELRDSKLRNFHLVTVLSKSEDPRAGENDERGYIDAALIKKYVVDSAECSYFIVGSPQFSEAMERILIELGVPKEQCKKDPFTGIVSQSAK